MKLLKKLFSIVTLFALLAALLAALPFTTEAHNGIEIIPSEALVPTGDLNSHDSSISADGRYTVFRSNATNLVSDDHNDAHDIFVYDNVEEAIERVSVNDEGEEAQGGSESPSISADGRYVAFSTASNNLAEDDNNQAYDVFVYDRNTDTIERVSVNDEGEEGGVAADSGYASISADGRYVAFYSVVSTLVPDDTNGAPDIFVYDRNTDTIERVSINEAEEEANSESFNPIISADGRFVSFSSNATNLVPDDTNDVYDIFVYDRDTDTIERVSVNNESEEADGSSWIASISTDGRYVVFASEATNLVASDTNGVEDIFVYDRDTDTIERVSVDSAGLETNSQSSDPSISSDGRFVSFDSSASNLVLGDTNDATDIFVYDRDTDTIERVSVGDEDQESDHSSWGAFISADGRYVSFTSETTNLVSDVYFDADENVLVRDRTESTTQVASLTGLEIGDTDTNGQSYGTSISADGRYVAFNSEATNLVPDDTNDEGDVFVHDRDTGIIERVSVNNEGEESDGSSYNPAISSDGRFVSFSSQAINLVPGDTNEVGDIFVYDRDTDTIERVSVSNEGEEASDQSSYSSISADGRFVTFSSYATNLVPGDTNEVGDIFVYDRDTDTIERVSVNDEGEEGNQESYDFLSFSISANGRFVTFFSYATNLVPNDTNDMFDIFVYDRDTDTIERVSVNNEGEEGDGASLSPVISADGRFVVFGSVATNLVPNDTNDYIDVFVYDRDTDTIEQISKGFNSELMSVSISADGRYVTFDSDVDNLVPDDTNSSIDIFVYDRDTDTIERVSVNDAGEEGGDHSAFPSLSADGRYVTFISQSSNLVYGDTNNSADVFVYDRDTDTIERVEIEIEEDEENHQGGNDDAQDVFISADGRYVVFSSDAPNLVSGDTNGHQDVFVYDRDTDTIERVSVNNQGEEGGEDSGTPFISADGRYVSFFSPSNNLVPDDTNGEPDVFVYDRDTDTIERVSVNNEGEESDSGGSYDSFITPNGRFVVFSSNTTNLVPDDANGESDVFVFDRDTDTIERVSVNNQGEEGDGGSEQGSISADGRYIVFLSNATNLVPNDTNDATDIFVFDRDTDTIERVSVSNEDEEGDASSYTSSISADGRFVVFDSEADNLVPDDFNDFSDTFVFDRDTDTIERVSVNNEGEGGDSGTNQRSSISADGRYVAFVSQASNLVDGDDNNEQDIFVYDRTLDTVQLVSANNSATEGNGQSRGTYLSADGRYVAFVSAATNLVSNDYNGDTRDVFIALIGEEVEEEIPSSSGSSGNYARSGCKNPLALNYNKSVRHRAELCQWGPGLVFPSMPSMPLPGTTSSPTNPTTPTAPCTPHLTSYISYGAVNNIEQVKKLETFLNEKQGELLPVDGIYASEDVAAVKRFQQKYHSEILGVWGLTEPTGNVLRTTQLKINSFYCNKTAAITCPAFTEFNSITENNISEEVQRTKALLTGLGFFSGPINTLFDLGLRAALKAFQEAFSETILKPWGLTQGTGYKYKTTNHSLNLLAGCRPQQP